MILAEWVKELRQREKYVAFFNWEFNPSVFHSYAQGSLALAGHDQQVASIPNRVPKVQAEEGWLLKNKKVLST